MEQHLYSEGIEKELPENYWLKREFLSDIEKVPKHNNHIYRGKIGSQTIYMRDFSRASEKAEDKAANLLAERFLESFGQSLNAKYAKASYDDDGDAFLSEEIKNVDFRDRLSGPEDTIYRAVAEGILTGDSDLIENLASRDESEIWRIDYENFGENNGDDADMLLGMAYTIVDRAGYEFDQQKLEATINELSQDIDPDAIEELTTSHDLEPETSEIFERRKETLAENYRRAQKGVFRPWMLEN